MRGHVQSWPRYYETTPRERTLGIWDKNRVVTEYGEIYDVSSYDDLIGYLIVNKIDLYCTYIMEFTYLPEAVICCDEVVVTGRKKIVGIRAKRGRYTAWIGSIHSWNMSDCTPASLTIIRQVMDHCAVGTQTTPGSLGQALWRKVWRDEEYKRTSRPSNYCRSVLFDHCVGGRADYFADPSQSYPTLYEIDLRSAYAAMCRRLPRGTAIAIDDYRDLTSYVTWYVQVRIVIRHTLDLAIFPVIENGVTYYPTREGFYDVWLWKEEIEAAQAAGCDIYISSGWAWSEWETGATLWATHMDTLRDTAPSQEVESIVKHAIVSAIGRHGMGITTHRVVSENAASYEDIPIILHGISSFAIHSFPDHETCNLTHWFSYIMARCRMTLYERMRDEQIQNTIVASNYDAIYLRNPTNLPTGAGLGQWRQTMLHDARVPYIRSILSREKNTTPGVPIGERWKI